MSKLRLPRGFSDRLYRPKKDGQPKTCIWKEIEDARSGEPDEPKDAKRSTQHQEKPREP